MAPTVPSNGRPWPGTPLEFWLDGQLCQGEVDVYDIEYGGPSFPVVYAGPSGRATVMLLSNLVQPPGTYAARRAAERRAEQDRLSRVAAKSA